MIRSGHGTLYSGIVYASAGYKRPEMCTFQFAERKRRFCGKRRQNRGKKRYAHQELLRGFAEWKATNIFDSHHLLVELVIVVTALLSIKILNLRCIGRGNACATTNIEEYIGIRKRGECHL